MKKLIVVFMLLLNYLDILLKLYCLNGLSNLCNKGSNKEMWFD